MSDSWKFIKTKDQKFEAADGRDHYWHFNPEIHERAGTYMVKVVMPKGGGHDFHRHPQMHEILYIIKGKAEQWVEDDKQMLTAGESVYIDADVVHATFNAGDGDLEFLAILSPSKGWEAGTIDVSDQPPYSGYRIK